MLAFRREECIAEERAMGFTHSHNDTHSWDAFHRHSAGAVEAAAAAAQR